MLLAYLLLLFLLHLSASTCDATSRNHRIFFHPGGSDVGAPSPLIHDHRHIISKDLFYEAHYPYRMMEATPPLPLLPGAESMRRPPDKEEIISAAMIVPSPFPLPSPSSPQVDDNGGYYGEPPGGGDVGGGDGEVGPPPSEATAATEQEESSAGDDVGVDYAAPKTHPPSHN